MKKLSSVTISGGLTVDQATTLSGSVNIGGIGTGAYTSVLVRNGSNQMFYRNYSDFVNDISASLNLSGYVPTSRTLTINGTTYDLSADRTWTINTVDYTSRLQHQVKAGVAINKGQAVYVTSADGTNMIVGLASNASEATSSKTMGLLDATVSTNGFANVVTEGLLAGLDTSTAGAEGDPVWLGTGGNLIYGLANKPYAPAHLVFIGIVTRKNNSNGEIFVKVQNGFELNEIHDVDLKTTVPVNGHILGFDGTLWVNKTIAGWLGYTPANASGTTNYISKFTGSTTLGNSLVYDNGTNVGVGTSSPGATLDVSGSLNTGKSIVRVTNSDTNNYITIGAGIPTISNAGMNFTVDGTSRMVISSSGNVGIGTTGPDVKFSVTPSTDVSAKIGYAFIGKGTDAGLSGWAVFGNIGAQAANQVALSQSGTGLTVLNAASGQNIRFRIANVDKAIIDLNGNVGIGTTTPSTKLDVMGAMLVNGGTNSTDGIKILASLTSSAFTSGIEFIRTTVVAGSKIQPLRDTVSGGVGLSLLVTANNAAEVAGTYTSALSILNNGNVGIGTTSPLAKLVVSNGTQGIEMGYSAGLAANFIQSISRPTGVDVDMAYYLAGAGVHKFYSNGLESVRITNAGNVGIGTASPSTKLDVSGVITATGGNSTNWNTAYGWGNHAGLYALLVHTHSAADITSGTLASARLSGSYAIDISGASSTSNTLTREDNRTISPSELAAGQLKFGFTSWANNNSAPYADFLHLRSYTDASGGSDNLVMFKKSGLGMRLWQQTWGSTSAYSSYVDVWTTGDFTSTSVSNWNTAYGWGNHASAGYLTSITRAQVHTAIFSTGGDANTYTAFGIYRNYAVNGPVGAHNTILNVMQTDGNYGFQLGADTTSTADGLYYRSKDATIGTWKQVASRDWVNTQAFVPQARTLTINGTTYDLSANRSWTIPNDLQTAANGSKVTTPVNVGPNVISSVSVGSYDGATFNYVIKDGTNFRAGTVIAVWNGTIVQYNETTTNDIGNTTSVVMSVAITAGNAELIATSSTPGWTAKVVPMGI